MDGSPLVRNSGALLAGPAVGAGAGSWLSGWSNLNDASLNATLNATVGAWRSRPIEVQCLFIEARARKWASVFPTSGAHYTECRALCDAGVVPIISLPVLSGGKDFGTGPNQSTNLDELSDMEWARQQYGSSVGNRRKFERLNSGLYDTAIANVATRIDNARTFGAVKRRVVLRPGWENTEIDHWSVRQLQGTGAARFVEWRDAFNRVVSIMRNILTTNCDVAWNVHKDYYANLQAGSPGFNEQEMLDLMDPGRGGGVNDANLTHITIDNYDGSPLAGTPHGSAYAAWRSKWDRVFDYAASRGKKTGVDEWGMRSKLNDELTAVAGGGSDNPTYIQYVYDLFSEVSARPANAGKLEWESFFEIEQNKGSVASSSSGSTAHCLGRIVGGVFVPITPWSGRTDGTLAGAGGAYVGQNSGAATNNCSILYRNLFGG